MGSKKKKKRKDAGEAVIGVQNWGPKKEQLPILVPGSSGPEPELTAAAPAPVPRPFVAAKPKEMGDGRKNVDHPP